MTIRTVGETGSTNADLIEAAGRGASEGTWLRAERQDAGRGRLGRTWVSPPGNLYASTIVRPIAGDPPAETLALAAGIALSDTLRAYAGAACAGVALKWPNDLLVHGAKIAGILLERAGGAVVIGFGVNLAHHPAGLERATTSLAQAAGIAPDPASFLEELVASHARWLARWRGEGLPAIRQAWLDRAHPIGTALTATTSHGAVDGLFAGLDSDGSLLLRTAERVEQVRAGDVFLL